MLGMLGLDGVSGRTRTVRVGMFKKLDRELDRLCVSKIPTEGPALLVGRLCVCAAAMRGLGGPGQGAGTPARMAIRRGPAAGGAAPAGTRTKWMFITLAACVVSGCLRWG